MRPTDIGVRDVKWLHVREPQSWCPECQAPWDGEHEIVPQPGGSAGTTFTLDRRDGPDVCSIPLGIGKDAAERELSRIADADSYAALWRRYEGVYASRALLDRLGR
jgi:hypothetical protein